MLDLHQEDVTLHPAQRRSHAQSSRMLRVFAATLTGLLQARISGRAHEMFLGYLRGNAYTG
jgi:hypothetical protein